MGRRRFAVSYLLVGLAAVAVYRYEHSQYAYWAIALYGAAGTAFGAWKMPRAERRPWLIIAAGVVLWVGGDVEWYAETLFGSCAWKASTTCSRPQPTRASACGTGGTSTGSRGPWL